MGFLDKILKGLGFEDEEPEVIKEPKNKEKKDKKKKGNITASFDLNQMESESEFKDESIDKNEKVIKKSSSSQTDFEMFKVKCQTDIQNCVLRLKDGARILVNIEELGESDFVRSLDFLTGAVYALGLKMQKIDEKLYLIQ